MKTIKVSLLLFFILSFSNLLAQADSATVAKKKLIAIKAGIFYNSGLNYYGRTDSLRSSGFFPLLEIGIGKKFYVTGAPIFVMNSAAPFEYAGSVATMGVRFSKEKKYSTNIYLVKPIYKESSELVQSALKLQGVATHTFITKYINFTMGADVKYSDKFDYGVTAGLDHLFRFQITPKSVLVANPSAYVNAGTQQFTKTSYRQSGFLLFPGTQQQVTENVSKFNILSYEFSMPIVFATGKWQLIANPAYVLPQNLVQVTGRPDLSERGRNMFYATMGARIVL